MSIGHHKDDNRQIIKKTSDKRHLLTGSRIHYVYYGKTCLHIHNLAGHGNCSKSNISNKPDKPAHKELGKHCSCIT